jgi:hypothetical protein
MHPQIVAMPGDKLIVAWDEPVKTAEGISKRIGLQVRSEDGSQELKRFITDENNYATYPVVKAVNENELIVAYTVKKRYGEYVKWQRVKLGS